MLNDDAHSAESRLVLPTRPGHLGDAGVAAWSEPVDIDTYLPALPEMATALDATESQAQLTLTTMLLGLGLGQLINGPLSDTIGRRLPIIIGFSGHIVASLLIAVAPTIEAVVVLRTWQIWVTGG